MAQRMYSVTEASKLFGRCRGRINEVIRDQDIGTRLGGRNVMLSLGDLKALEKFFNTLQRKRKPVKLTLDILDSPR